MKNRKCPSEGPRSRPGGEEMTWLELAAFVREVTNKFRFGTPAHGEKAILIVANPDCEGGAYDIWAVPTVQEAQKVAQKISVARAQCIEKDAYSGQFRATLDFEASFAIVPYGAKRGV